MKTIFSLLLISSFSWASEFESYQSTPSYRQMGALKIIDGAVDGRQAVKVETADKTSFFFLGTLAMNFNEAEDQCKELGWHLPTVDDAYGITFFGLFPDATQFEINMLGSEVHPFWFAEKSGPYTAAKLKGTDLLITFTDGSGPSGNPEVISLSQQIAAMEIPDSEYTPKNLTSDLALLIVLRAKLSHGVPVVCMKGDALIK